MIISLIKLKLFKIRCCLPIIITLLNFNDNIGTIYFHFSEVIRYLFINHLISNDVYYFRLKLLSKKAEKLPFFVLKVSR